MSKLKLKPVELRCSRGEKYKFVGGWAIVPGFILNGDVVKISLSEFKKLRGAE